MALGVYLAYKAEQTKTALGSPDQSKDLQKEKKLKLYKRKVFNS